PRTNNLDNLTALRKERVVPVRMKNSRLEIQFFHFRVLHFNPRRIMSPCKSRLDLKSGFGLRVRNQINDSLIADQRSCPVLGDERKHAMLDLVPFAGTWRKCETWICKPVTLARPCRPTFHSRERLALLPPASAMISNCFASG